MKPNHPTDHQAYFPEPYRDEEFPAYTQQYPGRPYFFFPPPFIIPILPFPPFFGRFPRRRFFW